MVWYKQNIKTTNIFEMFLTVEDVAGLMFA